MREFPKSVKTFPIITAADAPTRPSPVMPASTSTVIAKMRSPSRQSQSPTSIAIVASTGTTHGDGQRFCFPRSPCEKNDPNLVPGSSEKNDPFVSAGEHLPPAPCLFKVGPVILDPSTCFPTLKCPGVGGTYEDRFFRSSRNQLR